MSNNNNNSSSSSNNNKSGFQGSEISPYSDHAVGGGLGIRVPKTWSSERVPLPSHRTHSHVAASALMMPFSSGRTVPSKWVDAERWISSPVSVDNAITSKYYSHHHHHARTSHLVHHHQSYYSQRRTKSNSGPLGNDGFFSYGNFTNTYSPVLGMGVLHGGQWRNSDSLDSSANVGRARFEDDLVGNCELGGRKSCPGEPDWLELWSGPLVPAPQGEQDLHNDIHSTNNEGEQDTYDDGRSDNDEVVGVDNRIKSRREEMSTQMFEMSSSSTTTTSSVSSPKSNLVIPTSYYCSPNPQVDQEGCENASQSPESQVKDVQVDQHISTTPKSNLLVDTLHYNYDDSPSNSIVLNTHTKISKQQREQVRIKAWENLQKAKAQAAIQKLEMKLEKKRSLSMDKIVEKLKKAEIKAEKMRSSLSKGDDGQIQRHTTTTSFSKLPLFCRKIRLRSSVRSCSTCYPF